MTDNDTTVEKLKRKVSEFRDARDWLKYDTPRSLAISISVEAAELLEHFQWKNDEQMREVLMNKASKDEISDEMADVMIYCLGFSDVLGIDVSEAIERKLLKSAEKYPVVGPKLSA
jgi:NTP pyrophosphatase (non-canonical NTP hydrolase)